MVRLAQVEDLPYFKQLAVRADPHQLNELLAQCLRKCYPADTVIYRQGDQSDFVYIVQQGQVSHIAQLHGLEADSPKSHKPLVVSDKSDMFGDADIEKGEMSRKSTCQTTTKTTLILIPKDVFQKFKSVDQNSQYSAMGNPLLEWLSPAEKVKFCRLGQQRTYKYNQNVYRRGDIASEIYFVSSGQFRRQHTKNMPVNLIEAGCTFGQEELLNGGLRQHNLICNSTEATVWTYSRSIFEQYFLSNPYILKHLAHNSLCLHTIIDEFRIMLPMRQPEQKQRRTQILERKTQIPPFQDNSYFQNINKEYEFIDRVRLLQSMSKPRSSNYARLEGEPKPWFSNTDKKLKARMTRIFNMKKIRGTSPRQPRANRAQLLYRRLRTQTDAA